MAEQQSIVEIRQVPVTDLKLEELVKWLADPMIWNWTRAPSERDSADSVLSKLAELGFIDHRRHQYGGHTWTINGHHYGRTD